MKELKPCPFCGEYLVRTQGIYTNKYGKEYEEDYYSHAIMKNPEYCLAEEIRVGNNLKDITAWNTRTDGWVSVEERLPDKGVLVLLYLQNASETKITTGKIFNDPTFEKGIGEFCIGFDSVFPEFLQSEYVTHWQPLPEPPTRTDNHQDSVCISVVSKSKNHYMLTNTKKERKNMELSDFTEKTPEEILEILLDTLSRLEEEANDNRLALKTNRRSVALKNKGKLINASITTLTSLFEDLDIDIEKAYALIPHAMPIEIIDDSDDSE